MGRNDENAVQASAFEALRKMANFSIGLLRIIDDDIAPLGSGTLVRVGKTCGIVTAAHVWDMVEREKRIGFYQNPLRRSEIQSAAEYTTNLATINIGQETYLEVGPDIAFVRLPDTKASTLEMHGAFLNADRHHEVIIERRETDDFHLDAIVGMVEEWDKTVTMRDRAKVIRLDALTNVGRATKLPDGQQGFDRLLFEPIPEDGFVLPSSYGGVSGGGLFRVYVDGDSVSRVTLFGVAFWETKVGGKAEKIICHGPGSIYSRLVPMVKQRWP